MGIRKPAFCNDQNKMWSRHKSSMGDSGVDGGVWWSGYLQFWDRYYKLLINYKNEKIVTIYSGERENMVTE